MENLTEMYNQAESPANHLSGFTKSFVKRTKDKKEEDVNVKELLAYVREKKVILGAKVTEKAFKRGQAQKVYVSTNPDKLTFDMVKHYANIAGIEIIQLDLDNQELSQKLGKPFLVSMVCVINA